MHEPEDYGLDAVGTLGSVAPTAPPPGFTKFWSSWAERVLAHEPELTAESLDPARAGAPGVTHVLTSLGGVRLGCRLVPPAGGAAPEAIIIRTHGYPVDPGEVLDDEHPWSNRPVSVLKLRIRGFPGSIMDTGQLAACETGWVTHGLESGEGWVLFDAIADLVNAARAARSLVGPGVPIYMHGESFGGGLAILAASMLHDIEPIGRLALAVPTFGWWRWRVEKPMLSGAGFEIGQFLNQHRRMEEEILETLAMADTVVHAPRVHVPAVCKLAQRDDVVPAPTAAAVFNALGCDRGRKWRFVTPYGHFDGGVADLRRHALFERLIGDFLDPSVDLDGLMRRWEPVLMDGQRPPED